MKYTFLETTNDKIPIKFGFGALAKYSEQTNTTLADLDKLGNGMRLDQALLLIMCGIEDGFRAAKQDCNITVSDLADMIDEDHDLIANAMNILAEQMGGSTKKKGKANKVKGKN